MKTTIAYWAFILSFFIFNCPCIYFLSATNRADTKKSVPYRANYLRMTSGNNANHTLEIRNGTLWAWGKNYFGQLGDGTTADKYFPVQIGSDSNWVLIASGSFHSLAIKSDGTLWAWGRNLEGQLGDGTSVNKSIPTKIGTDAWLTVIGGSGHTLGIKSNGTLWYWGAGNIVPVQIGIENNWVSIAAGEWHSLALMANGSLWGWGYNGNGQVGIGTYGNQVYNPTQVGTECNWTKIAAGPWHSLAIKADGTLWGWGLNSEAQLGIGTIYTQQVNPVQIGIENNWVNIAAGGKSGYITGGCFSLGLKSNGTLWAWGANLFGQLGKGDTIRALIPNQVGTENNWVAISAGMGHSVALKANGTLWACGLNSDGQIGDGTDSIRISPTQICTPALSWLSISSGASHSLAIKTDGTLWAWGYNGAGKLGDGLTFSQNSPIQIGIENNWISASAGRYSSLGIKSDGSLWAWGGNIHAQLGDGTQINRYSPVQIGTDNDWVSIAQGYENSFALKSNGTLWGWGHNQSGEVGDGTTIMRKSPVQIGTDNNWVGIEAPDWYFTLALKVDGTLWGWGTNYQNELGNGTAIPQNSPSQIGTDNKWISVSGGYNHAQGLKSDGTLWSWGKNDNGELGDGTTIKKTFPTQIATDQKWISVSVSNYHSIGLKSDGTLWAWGNNCYGALGDGTGGGTYSQRSQPEQICSDNNWIGISTGSCNSFGRKINEFCATGWNYAGCLGDGTFADKNFFQCSINCNPPLSPNVNDTIICLGDSAILVASGTGTFGWYSSDTGGVYLGGGSTFITPSLTSTTIFYVQDSTSSGSSQRTAVQVIVNPLPILNATASDTILCPSSPITLSATGASAYTWSNGITDSVEFTLDSTTTFTVIGTDTNNCSDTASVLIKVYPLPTVTPFATATKICSGDSISLLATGANSYSWSDNIFNGVNFIPPLTHTYTVIGTDTNNCSDTASITITVNDPQVIAYTTASSICEGEKITLTTSGAVNYSWSGGVLNNTPFLPDSTTTFTVIGTDEINCSDTASITITVHQSPMITVNASDTEICIGTPLILTADGTQTYFWSDGIVNNIPFFPFVTKVFFVTGTDSNNCSDTASIKIIVNPLPAVIPYATSTTICEGEEVSIIATGAETYQWSDGISNGVSFIPTSTNSYTVIGIDSNNCSDTASITITVNSFPDIMLSLDGATITANQEQAEYQWLNCDDGLAEISGATEQSYTAVENGNYAVFIDLDGCMDTSECVTVNNVGVADLADGVGWIKVFPNPSPGIFTIQSSVAISSITITNLIGEMIFELKCPLSSCTEQSRSVIEEGIPIRLMEPEGIYFLKIESGSKMEMKKIVLQ